MFIRAIASRVSMNIIKDLIFEEEVDYIKLKEQFKFLDWHILLHY